MSTELEPEPIERTLTVFFFQVFVFHMIKILNVHIQSNCETIILHINKIMVKFY